MRIIVFFDLPVTTAEERRACTRFRKFLVKNGFLMMQESVYSKIVLNMTAGNVVVQKVKSAAPKDGLIQALVITEKQYAGIIMILGKKQSEVVESNECLVVL